MPVNIGHDKENRPVFLILKQDTNHQTKNESKKVFTCFLLSFYYINSSNNLSHYFTAYIKCENDFVQHIFGMRGRYA